MTTAQSQGGQGAGRPALLRLIRRCRKDRTFDGGAARPAQSLLAWLAVQLAVEQNARSGLALVPAGLIVGAVGVFGCGWRPSGFVLIASAGVLLCCLALSRNSIQLRSLAILALAAIAGATLSCLEIRNTHTVIFSGEATVRIEGRVIWRDRDERGRYRYLIQVADTQRPKLSRPPQQARILVSSDHVPLPIGGTYRGLVRLRPPSGPALPHAHDFAYAAFFEGPGAFGFSLGPPDEANASPAELSLGERLATLRLHIGERVHTIVGGPEGAVAAALIMGDRAGIPDEIDDALRETGLSHVLSISGLHMALVAGFVMILVRVALAAVPGAALLLPSKKIAAVAALLASSFYLVLSGGGAATNRSFLMIVVMLAAVLADRPALTLRNVAVAATTLLALTPHVVLTASFQMSFAATASLVGVAGHLLRGGHESERSSRTDIRGRLGTVGRFFLGLAGTSIVAGLATAPFAAYHFGRVAPFGLLANMIAIPVFSFWIMPLALVAVLLMPFGLDAPFLHLIGYGLTLVFSMAGLLADALPDQVSGSVSSVGLTMMAGSIIVAAFCASGLRWLAAPVAAIGILLAPDRTRPPELLVFENGKEVALIGSAGELVYLRPKPSAFVAEQWNRLFEAIPSAPTITDSQTKKLPLAFACNREICRATTRNGVRVSWTDSFEITQQACEESDVAIIARAVRDKSCRSGARLLSLRTLRRTGSLAISRNEDTNRVEILPSVERRPNEWNRHRHARWPEHWRNPNAHAATSRTDNTARRDATVSSVRQDVHGATVHPAARHAPPRNDHTAATPRADVP